MWAAAAAPLPVYSTVQFKDTRKRSKPDITEATSLSTNPIPPLPQTSNAPSQLLEPAVDGPPSPERLRQINKQMRGSIFERNPFQHQHQPSSGSSSLRSLTLADRPSWEQTLDAISLSRRSSSRSTTSSMAYRERPDSVQVFGKSIFNRRGKYKRESKSSSGSSIYSGEAEAPTSNPSSRDYFIPIVLRKRRATTMKDNSSSDAASQKKLQISGPYNFQHVTHARRDLTRDGDSSSALDSDAQHFRNFSSEGVHLSYTQEQEDFYANANVQFPPPLRPQILPPRRLVKRSLSQEQLKVAPPRPPRSPPPEPISPPIPPPRVSSRVALHLDSDRLSPTSFERPPPGSSFSQPRPFSPTMEHPTMSPGYFLPVGELDGYFDPRFSHAITTPDDAAWPMTSSGTLNFENTLPEVPEEEEHHSHARSRMSVVSNSSSLRGSHSVPALRCAGQRQSNASETLGRFDLFAAQKALQESIDKRGGSGLPRENWEDVIDYCYDHQAEADFEYEWERSSIDMRRPLSRANALETEALSSDIDCLSPKDSDMQRKSSEYLAMPCRFDIPELSPASQASNLEREEALTPTTAPPASAHFSFSTEVDKVRSTGKRSASNRMAPHIRVPSHASSFKESHGFTLSPSLLIPTDYHQEMLLARTGEGFYNGVVHIEEEEEVVVEEKEEEEEDEEEKWLNVTSGSFLAEPSTMPRAPITALDPEHLRAQLRASISTLGSDTSSSGPSEISTAAERHISTTSTSTAYSRFTVESSEMKPEVPIIPKFLGAQDDDTSSILGDLPSGLVRSIRSEHSRNRSIPFTIAAASNETVVSTDESYRESIRLRRQRSKTTSSANGPAPTYGLFPRLHVTGNRI